MTANTVLRVGKYIFLKYQDQGLDKIMETLEIIYTFLYEHGDGPTSAFNTATMLLGMDLSTF